MDLCLGFGSWAIKEDAAQSSIPLAQALIGGKGAYSDAYCLYGGENIKRNVIFLGTFWKFRCLKK